MTSWSRGVRVRRRCGKAFDEAAEKGIRFLQEGTHIFTLENGARLKVYASPYTPCSLGEEPTWGFQYRRGDGHHFAIDEGTDIAVTHGPPRGIYSTWTPRKSVRGARLFSLPSRGRGPRSTASATFITGGERRRSPGGKPYPRTHRTLVTSTTSGPLLSIPSPR